MVEPSSVAEEALRKITARLKCSVCLDTYTNAKLLPCFHSFCKRCLERLVVQDRNGHTLTCPNCRRTTPLPPTGVSGLQTDFHVEHLLEIRETLAKLKEPQKTQCEKCEKYNATGFCRDCGKFICEKCIEIHDLWKDLSIHNIVTIKAVQKEAANFVLPTKKVMYCPKHLGSMFKIYCETCGELICSDCTIRLHQGHNYDLVTDTFPKHKEEIVSSLQPVKHQLATINKAVQALDTRTKEIEDQRTTVEADIHKQIDCLQQALEQRRTELVGQLNQLTQQKLKGLAALRHQFELVQTHSSSCLDYVEGSLKTGSEGEILTMKTSVLKQIHHITTEFNPNMLVPEQEANLALVTDNDQDLHQACREFAKVAVQPACPEKCYATGDGLRTATAREEATVTLHAVDRDGGECEVPVHSVTAQLVHSNHCTAVKCEVVKNNRTTCSIKYTPTIRGKHNLHIQVRKKHIRGSPFTVTSMPSPQDLGNPIQKIEHLRGPQCMVTNTHNQIVVPECTRHCVSVLNSDGKKVRSFGSKGSGNGQFNSPRGITQDNEGNIYVVDEGNNRIQKFTSGGNFISTVGKGGTDPLQFDTPVGITFNTVNGKLYVCDCHRIQVLNTDLTLHSIFGSQGNGIGQFERPVCSACDKTGNVYIADLNNHRIQVFTPEGMFLRTLGSMGSGPGQFIHPTDVTIGDNKLYVCDRNNNRICVFTTDGVFLTSFSSHGQKHDQLKPVRIHITEDSYLLVSEHSNHRIQVF